MSRALISRSRDLQRLVDEGYEVEIRSGFLLVHAVPYVNARKEVQRGTLISNLALAGDITAYGGDHVAFFIGEQPCNNDGTIITGIQHQMDRQQLAADLTADRSFSNKPTGGYADYFHKVSRYIEIISAPAASLSPEITAKTFKPVEMAEAESVFAYMDTASTRAGIAVIGGKLGGECVGIIGVGGTGSYVLDLVAKTHVQEIHLFDADRFVNHNAFRAPGAVSIDDLRLGLSKVAYFRDVYAKMRRGIFAHDHNVTESNLASLNQLTFAFVCIDKPSAKPAVFEKLEQLGISFVDVGMGIEAVDERLRGVLRVTTSTTTKREHLSRRISVGEIADDDYRTNIQVAELNALNAALAVIKWKKLRGFYLDLELEHESTYSIDCNLLTSDERQ
jgi:hypothetical protein